jgi:hypothetical protein
MTGNILGESVPDFVKDEVKNRQKILGKGINGDVTKTPTELHYINNRIPWVKLASSVFIEDENRLPFGIGSTENFKGINLAKKAVLFNGLSSLNDKNSYSFRSGVNTSKSFWNNNLYGLGGTAQGIQPSPGIRDVSVTSKNNGSIRSATINLVAYNRFQFELIELLYLRLGFTLLLEFGWNTYLDKDGKIKTVGSTLVEDEFFKENGTTQLEMLEKIKTYQESYSGNYDGFFGRIKNFSWDFKDDGTYHIKVDLISLGDVIEALKVNIPPSDSQREKSGASSKAEIKKFGEVSDSVLLANKNSSRLSAYLYETLGDPEMFKNNTSYFNLAGAVNYRDAGYDHNKIDANYNYFIRFGELISVIEKEIVPNISPADKQLLFETNASDTTLVNYTPNLISFDPKVCIFKYDDGTLNQGDIKDVYVPQYTKSILSAFSKLTGDTSEDSQSLGEVSVTTNDPTSTNLISLAQTIKIKKYDPNTKTVTIEGGISFTIDDNGNSIFASSGVMANSYSVLDMSKLRGDSSIKKGDVVFLKLYNIYINYGFIFKSLSKNMDKEGNLSIYKFLEEICSGINNSLANTTQISPYIKDDKIVTFIERKPPTGISKNLNKIKGVPTGGDLELQVFGFDKTKNESNFLKSIKFNTKITPMLANQISIGATASGHTVGEDATAFSKWNNGLVDRFQRTITTPTTTTIPTSNATTDEEETTQEKEIDSTKVKYGGNDPTLKQILNNPSGDLLADPVKFPLDVKTTQKVGSGGGSTFTTTDDDSVKDTYHGKLQPTVKVYRKTNATYYYSIDKDGVILENEPSKVELFNTDNKKFFSNINPIQDIISRSAPINSPFREDIKNALINAYGAPSEAVKEGAENTTNQDVINQEVLERAKKITNINYSAYLSQMFGGKPTLSQNQIDAAGVSIQTISKPNAQYLPTTNDEYVEMGKNVYKNYLQKFYGKFYSETGIPSNAAGFIPVEFSITLDGLSGFRMFNKINIQQSFLPSQYSATLEFLITGLSQKITDRGWETNLKTLSTSNIESPPSIKFNPAPTVSAQSGGTTSGFDPGDKFTQNKRRGSGANACKLKSDSSIPVENGFLHRYPGMLVEADAALYARLKMNNSKSDDKKLRLHYAAMPHFKKLLSAYESAISENGKTFLERYGKLRINSAYRQIQKTPSGASAAAPGRSRHGLGLAVDLQQPASYEEVHSWFVANAPALGWMRIPILRNGTNETWHWELQMMGTYAKISQTTYFTKSNIKKSGGNGKSQYNVSPQAAKGVENLKPSYILDQSIYNKQKTAQTLAAV